MACAFWVARVLLTAVDLDLFTILGSRGLTIDELVTHLDTDRRGTEILANALVSLELLTLDRDRYASSTATDRFLNRHSSEYRGDVVRLASSR